MNKIKVLVFPCGSEVGLEIYRSLKYSRHIELYGASSVKDHGRFVYDNYFGDLPFINDDDFIIELKKIIKRFEIDALYPAMDIAIAKLKSLEKELGCLVISSPSLVSEICFSKKKTYTVLQNIVPLPKVYDSMDEVDNYPVFIKPDVGYGSRGVKIINSYEEGKAHIRHWGDCLILEYLPNEEYTVDCFTDRNRELLFVGPRPRLRTRTGISVNSVSIETKDRLEFQDLANKINEKIPFRGAWFFQVKRNVHNELVLLEVAARLGGSSSLYRYKGINFSLLSVFDAFNFDVNIIENDVQIEIERALDVKVKCDYFFDNVYVDFDDCLVIDGMVNTTLVAKIYEYINEGKKIILLSKHRYDIRESLKKYKLESLFDEIIHIRNLEDKKSKYIKNKSSIFIDDSYAERKDVHTSLGIPVYSPDMITVY